MNLSIIIVNWNVRPLLEQCLRSINDQLKGLDYEIIVVDNASQDRSAELLQNLKPQTSNLKFISNKINLGFAKANNQAIKIAQGEFILFLNPDTALMDDSLRQGISFLKNNLDCGILGGQLIGDDNQIQPSVRKFPDLISQALILLKIHHLFPGLPILKKYFCLSFDYQKIQEVNQVMGAFLLMRKDLLNRLNGFDEKFFLWFEEVDLCWRAQKMGYKIIYYPGIKTKHHGHQSFDQARPYQKQKIYNQSLIYFFYKNHSFWSALILRFCHPLSLLLALIGQIFIKQK